MVGRVSDKVAVITGGASGIGLSSAKLLAEEGAQVIIVDRAQPDALRKAEHDIGHDSVALQVDVSRMPDLDRMVAEVQQRFGRIDIFFANAGMILRSAMGEISEEEFDLHMNVNVKGVLFSVQKALPLMPPGSSVIMTSSCMAQMGAPGHTAYSATKAAIRSFARSWSIDLQPRQIRVNTVSPGGTLTPLLEASGISPNHHPDVYEAVLPMIPMGRLGDPSEVARAVLFLASNDSSYMTGADVAVDGGFGQV